MWAALLTLALLAGQGLAAQFETATVDGQLAITSEW